MSITDELREYVGLGDGIVQCSIRAIADRIDESWEREEADFGLMCDKIAAQATCLVEVGEALGVSADQPDSEFFWELAEAARGCIPLPKDADGIPIRPGDVVDVPAGGSFEGRAGVEVEHIELRERWLVAVSGDGGTEYYRPEHVVHADDSFGARLRALLKERGMRQSDLAREMGVSQAVVSCWVRGAITPRFDMLQSIREALGCSWGDLMGAR